MTSAGHVIPLVDLQAAHSEVADEITSGFHRVMAAGAFIKGLDVTEFEREFASFSGIKHCVAVANGTDALELALRAAGIPPGGEVIVPANTFVATAEAVVRAGARPVFCDVDPDHLLLDPDVSDSGDEHKYCCDIASALVRPNGSDERTF